MTSSALNGTGTGAADVDGPGGAEVDEIGFGNAPLVVVSGPEGALRLLASGVGGDSGDGVGRGAPPDGHGARGGGLTVHDLSAGPPTIEQLSAVPAHAFDEVTAAALHELDH
ncbi:MAG: hypothetical protein GEV08_25055, partial [Acidimicrobiia bacterium]|nr:hypothetical protein [Acidimicrobiia bacterium]